MKDGYLDDDFHFAQMVSLMGPPPKEFLERSEQCRKYWDSEGEVLLLPAGEASVTLFT
jgi:hypothetical protein